MRARTLLPAVLAVLALAGCGTSGSSGPEASGVTADESYSTAHGTIVNVTFPSGLRCDVFDTSKGGGTDCDFESFAFPSEWEGRTGEVERVDVNNETMSVVVFRDGHYCVAADGTESGTALCHYPQR